MRVDRIELKKKKKSGILRVDRREPKTKDDLALLPC